MTGATWLIAGLATAGVILRPFAWPEFVWAVAGALILLALGLLPPGAALAGVLRGSDVYLFLAGMMLLAELARQEGLLTWLASRAAYAARSSATRLFALVFGVGTVVTALLSNDATAVVLTPAVAAVARAARAPALPYLYTCAFIANAASFVLPISNPATSSSTATPCRPCWNGCRATAWLPCSRSPATSSPSAGRSGPFCASRSPLTCPAPH